MRPHEGFQVTLIIDDFPFHIGPISEDAFKNKRLVIKVFHKEGACCFTHRYAKTGREEATDAAA